MHIEEENIVDKYRDHIPVVFLPGDICKKYSLLIVEADKKSLIANAVPIHKIKSKVSYASRRIIYVNTLLYERLNRPKTIHIRFPKKDNTLFVYGSLLSKYWDLHDGILHSGWYSFDLEKRIKGAIRGYRAIWPLGWTYPYAVGSMDDFIVGEECLYVSDDDISRIDIVESEYRRVEVTLYPLENLINNCPLRTYVYVSKRNIDGPAFKTFLYGESFYITGSRKFVTYDYQCNFYIKSLHGNIPIVISCPHGGYARPENVPVHIKRSADPRTLELSEEIVIRCYTLSGGTNIPSVVISRIHPSRVDVNRPNSGYTGLSREIYETYHSQLAKMISMIRKENRCVIIDIHGMGDRDFDIAIGTNYGESIVHIRDIYEELLDILEQNFNVTINPQGYAGQYITKHYGKYSGVGVIQIELTRHMRTNPDKFERFVNTMAEFLVEVSPDRKFDFL